jgi:hypothetical protein
MVAAGADGVQRTQPTNGGRMKSKGYTVLGWAVWQVATRVPRRKMAGNKLKVGAAATVLLVLVGGLAIVKAASGGDEDN